MYDLDCTEIPAEILSIEEENGAFGDNNPSAIEHLLGRVSLFRSNAKNYNDAYTTMIHLEEAAQSTFIKQFNTKNIRLLFTEEPREFRIRNNVSLNNIMKYFIHVARRIV